ncbi:MAG: hypothetical protein IT462_11045 [Planctomycetes bacterium]|nr:hypothetical protein [Planctomycetota bacterium]
MTTTKSKASEMKPEYDFSKGVRGKYAKRFAQGTNLVLLDPDIAEAFKDSESINVILRAYLVGAAKGRKKSGR